MAVGGNLAFGDNYNVALNTPGTFTAPGDEQPTVLLVGGGVDYASSSPSGVLQVLHVRQRCPHRGPEQGDRQDAGRGERRRVQSHAARRAHRRAAGRLGRAVWPDGLHVPVLHVPRPGRLDGHLRDDRDPAGRQREPTARPEHRACGVQHEDCAHPGADQRAAPDRRAAQQHRRVDLPGPAPRPEQAPACERRHHGQRRRLHLAHAHDGGRVRGTRLRTSGGTSPTPPTSPSRAFR